MRNKLEDDTEQNHGHEGAPSLLPEAFPFVAIGAFFLSSGGECTTQGGPFLLPLLGPWSLLLAMVTADGMSPFPAEFPSLSLSVVRRAELVSRHTSVWPTPSRPSGAGHLGIPGDAALHAVYAQSMSRLRALAELAFFPRAPNRAHDQGSTLEPSENKVVARGQGRRWGSPQPYSPGARACLDEGSWGGVSPLAWSL